MSVARYAHDGVEVLGGKIYFVGGHSTSELNIAERYDPSTNTWETLSFNVCCKKIVASTF